MHCGNDNAAIASMLTVMAVKLLSILTQLLSVSIKHLYIYNIMLCVITIVTMYITSVTSSYCDGSIFTVFMK